jgi:regulator of sirC expression with transglutaminase-like and TPR domain
MSDAAKLIEELARHIERGEELDPSELAEIHARIERLRESLKAGCGEKGQNARAAKAAELLIEKIILQSAGNASAALGDLGHILATVDESSPQT